jgi:hypothetical protein
MESLIAVEKDYGYVVAIVASIIGVVVFKRGYEDYAPSGSDIAKEDYKMRGIFLMVIAAAIVSGSWYLAYTYQQ